MLYINQVAGSSNDEGFTDLQYNEFQFPDVIRVNPILCDLTGKVLLTASYGAVGFVGYQPMG